ncbi:MAG: prolyl oligopeptidase family serine peptidase [Woeseiaceae bacterium]|nr:prolyl oligopeptidase family serine peptidase [Woeseiaceae bacterium]
MRVLEDGKHSILFMDRASNEVLGSLQYHGKNEVGSFYWANHERVVAHVYELGQRQEAPINYGELIAGNYDGSRAETIFGYRAGERGTATILRKKDIEYAWGEVIDPLPENKKEILISSQSMSSSKGRPPAAEFLDVYSGHSGERVRSAKFAGGRFLTDGQGVVRMVTGSDENLRLHVEGLPAGTQEWVEFDTSNYGSNFWPVAISDDKKSAFVLANVESDKLGLYKLSLDGTQFKEIYVNETVDITSVNLTPDGRGVYAMRIDKNFPSYLLLSKTHEEAAVFKQLLQLFPGHAVEITSDSEDGRFWIVNASSDVDPGSYFLLDREENSLRPLFRSLPDIDANELSKVEPIEFESFDGLSITGYFTRAIDSGNKAAPMIVLVHGGPRLRDYWEYDPYVQTLATRGFSVLQINFRGSTGFGANFMHAGDRHWGDHVQQDIIAGTRWAIADGRAQKGKICIMGASFGAYSAVQSATLAPDLFACAVANAGIYDLELLYTKGDVEDLYFGDTYLEEAIGRDEEQLRKFSPVHNVAALEAPVFIVHGKADDRAPYEHAKRLMKALDEHDKEYDSFILRREAHGFYDTRNQVTYMEKALKFLNKHLR